MYAYYQKYDIEKTNEEMIGYTYSECLTGRQFHQQAAFIFSMLKNKSLLELLKNYFGDDNTKLIRLVFSFKSRDDFAHAIDDIKHLGITYASLFPDIDGYSKEVF